MFDLNAIKIALILIGVVFPVYSLLTSKKSIERLLAEPEKLAQFYKETSVFIIAMVGIVLGAMLIDQENIMSIGLTFLANPLYDALLFIIPIGVLFLLKNITIGPAKLETIAKGFDSVRHIMPSNKEEFNATIFTSFVAGIGEEIVFRGFLFWQFSLLMPVIPAILLANIIFGLCHAATSTENSIKAFVLGLLFSGLYYLTGSLWLSMLLHIIIDIYSFCLAMKIKDLRTNIETH